MWVVCCKDDAPHCVTCSLLPESVLRKSEFIHRIGGVLPPMQLQDDGHFMSLLDLLEAQLKSVPMSLFKPLIGVWRPCTVCNTFFFSSTADLQRHSHWHHQSQRIENLSAEARQCGWRLQRPLDHMNVPVGEVVRCLFSAGTMADLVKHRQETGHLNPENDDVDDDDDVVDELGADRTRSHCAGSVMQRKISLSLRVLREAEGEAAAAVAALGEAAGQVKSIKFASQQTATAISHQPPAFSHKVHQAGASGR